MSSSDFPGPDPSAAEGSGEQLFDGVEPVAEEPESVEAFRQRNREILDGIAEGLGFRQSAEMAPVRAYAAAAFRSGDAEDFAEMMAHWHDLAMEVVDAEDRPSGLEIEKAGIGYMLARAGFWQEVGDAGNFWEEMAAATMAVQSLPEVHLPLQGHVDRMSAGWQLPDVEGLLEAASGYVGPEEAQELSTWLPDEVLIVVLGRLLQSGVRDIKLFLIEHGLISE